MQNWQDLLTGSAVVGVGTPLLGKAHEIAMHTKDAHGTMWKWDADIAKKCLKDNVKGTVTIAIVTAVAFAAASWVSRVSARDSKDAGMENSEITR